MPLVTRDIDPALALDLLERAPRACLAFAAETGPSVMPVELLYQDGRCRISQAGLPQLAPGQEVVLLVDEGIYYFDLRAIYVRAEIQPGETWAELIPIKIVAWDYGAMRAVRE